MKISTEVWEKTLKEVQNLGKYPTRIRKQDNNNQATRKQDQIDV